MKGIIIGGGIAGLTTAIALQKKNIDFTLYESAAEFKPLGAGIAINPNGLNVLKKLDINLYNQIKQKGYTLKYAKVTDIFDNLIQLIDFDKIIKKYGHGSIAISRSDLHTVLSNHIPKDKIVLSKRLSSCSQEQNFVEAVFEDNTKAQGEFLIGSDGIKSIVRKNVLGDIPLRYSGQTCWRGLLNYKLPDDQMGMKEVWGEKAGLRFGYLPINHHQVYWYATFSSEPEHHDIRGKITEKLLNIYDSFQPLIKEIIESTPEENIIRNDIFDFVPIKKWTNENIALVGDSAHSTTPNLGQGANQALESSLVIAQCLSANKNISQAFKNYQYIRIKKATQIVNISWMISKITNIDNYYFRKITQSLMKHTPDFINQKQLDTIFSLNYLEK